MGQPYYGKIRGAWIRANEKKEVYMCIKEINDEIREYQFMLRNAIELGRKEEINMWRRAIQTAKIQKRRLAKS